MKQKEIAWYRQMAAPGVEYRWELAGMYPKKFRLIIRSTQRADMVTAVEAPDMNSVPVTSFLIAAHTEFMRQIGEQVLHDRKRRLDQIAAREAEGQRAIQERQERKPDGAPEGQPVEDDAVSANPDAGQAEESVAGAGRGAKRRGKRRQGKPQAGADASATVHQAGS